MMKGWKILSFGELGRVFNGNSISEAEKKAHFEGIDVGVPYIGTKDVSFDHEVAYESGVKIPADRRDDFKLAPANTVLVCAEGGSAGRKIAHTNREIYFGNKLFAICPSPPISSRLIFYYCLSDDFTKQFKGAMAGLIGGVSIKKFKELRVPVPPLTEQHRIVALLDDAFANIATAKANAEKNLQNARALFESYLQSVFTQRREGWLETRLADICERVSVGHVGPTSEFYCHPSEGIPFLRSQNVRPGKLDWEGVQYITKEFHGRLRKSQIRFGDLLFVRVGANRGDCCAVLEDVAELNCANIVFARPTRGNAAYLERYCQSPPGRAQLLGMTTGSAQGVINTKSVAELVVPMPEEAVQEKVVSKLDKLHEETQRLARLYERKHAALEELKKSLLHQAFNGEL
jgi:type I restriction enzyme S subunit